MPERRIGDPFASPDDADRAEAKEGAGAGKSCNVVGIGSSKA